MLKYPFNVFDGGGIFSPTTVNLNRFILQQNKDLTDTGITNYKINQQLTSDFSVEKREKNSNRT